MSNSTTFKQVSASASNQYLWSNSANWTNGVPVDGDSVIFSAPNFQGIFSGPDDIPSLSLSSLTLNSGANISISGDLTVSDVITQTAADSSGYYFVPILAAAAQGANVSVDATSGDLDANFWGIDGGRISVTTTAAEEFLTGSGGAVEVVSQPVAGDQFVFDSSGGTIQFDTVADATEIGNAGTPSLSFIGTASGDSIELPGLSVSSVSITANDIKIVTNSTTLDLVGVSYSSGATMPTGYNTHFDTNTSLETVTFVACYVAGTLIETDCGEVAVEHLAIGDRVRTVAGNARPIRWIGRRSYAGRFLAANPGAQPIRFSAGSLGSQLPRRDLLVSPEHAMFLDGVLIPARCLVNGGSIVQERTLERVDYFHVELDSHDVILAEGAPCESFLDDASRGMFQNAHEFSLLYPDAPAPGGFCAPRLASGSALDAIRRRLDGLHVCEMRLDRTGSHRIEIPSGVSAIRLITRPAFTPGDRRRLGSAISAITLDGVRVDLDGPRLLTGWHACEGTWRWTDGAALLLVSGAKQLEVIVASLQILNAA